MPSTMLRVTAVLVFYFAHTYFIFDHAHSVTFFMGQFVICPTHTLQFQVHVCESQYTHFKSNS